MIKPSQPIVYNFHANFPMFVLFQVIAIPDRSRLSLLITCRPALQRNHVQPCPTMSNHVQPCSYGFYFVPRHSKIKGNTLCGILPMMFWILDNDSYIIYQSINLYSIIIVNIVYSIIIV